MSIKRAINNYLVVLGTLIVLAPLGVWKLAELTLRLIGRLAG